MIPLRFPLLVISLAALTSCGAQESDLTPDGFAEAAATAGAAERADGQIGIQGDDAAWLFLFSELIHLGHGEFWTKDWTQIATAATDPAPVITAYKDALADKGVELLVVPVPPKAAIYPEKFSGGADIANVPPRSSY